MVDKISAELPELPEKIYNDLLAKYDLSPYDAELIIQSKHYVAYFQNSMALGTKPPANVKQRAKTISNWMLGEFTRLLNAKNVKPEEAHDRVPEANFVEMLDLVEKGTLSGPLSKTVFEEMFNSGKKASTIVAEKGLVQISDSGELGIIVDKIIADNEKAVVDYKAGKEASLTFLMGQVMKASRGKANPSVVRQLIVDKLGGN
jgi:aspartyl-tRNA(Asn)/glutamyl-tRNA(Gln) amidotransferase subunit B